MTTPEKLGVLNQSLLGQFLMKQLVDFRVEALSQLKQDAVRKIIHDQESIS